ncbi:rod shape-determining protein MreC [Phycisphaerales bacterium AB-hyl4]|uniref:Cell shape-determining protein MreC n=1 Tax=Natronomicrosphaera hydrolytica TaxID=3242702 RepID=A0ABV4U533_9BACT
MRRSLLTPRRALVLVTAVLLVTSLLPLRVVSWVGNPAREVVAAVQMPVTVPLKSIGDAVRRPTPVQLDVADEHHPGHARLYIERLEQEVEQLRRENQALQQVRGVLGEERSVQALLARVGGVSGDRLNPTLRINRGSRDGVGRGQAVVSGFTLVGEIERAGPVSADVRLFTAAETRLQVRIIPSDPTAEERRYTAWMDIQDGGSVFVIEAERGDPVEAGDWAHLADERWPREARGFVVAQVIDARPDPSDPHRLMRVTLSPAVDLMALRQVTVLVPE